MSKHILDLCIVWDGVSKALWVTPSHATHLLESDPRMELIEELHPYFEDYLQLAGPKPQVFAEETDAQTERAGDDP